MPQRAEELIESYAILNRVFPDDMHIARPYIRMLQQAGNIESARNLALAMASRMLAGGSASHALGLLAICRQLHHPDHEQIESLSDMARYTFGDHEQPTQTFTLIEQLSDAEALDFIAQGRNFKAAVGEHIVSQGEESRTFYLILDGELNVSITAADGHSTIVKQLVPGDFFGEFACLYKLPRSATVTAATTAHLLEFSDAAIEKLMQETPLAGEYLIRTVQQRMVHAMTHSMPAFTELQEADRNWLAEEATVDQYSAGETIPDHPDTACTIVINGSAELRLPDGSSLTLQPGAMFGQAAPQLQLPAGASLNAGERTLLCRIPDNLFHAFTNIYASFDQQIREAALQGGQK